MSTTDCVVVVDDPIAWLDNLPARSLIQSRSRLVFVGGTLASSRSCVHFEPPLMHTANGLPLGGRIGL
jgi:hypothetical protein